MEPVIITEHLSRQFGELWAVRDLCLTVEQGHVFGFLGPNGAGKTTTVRLLNGILEPTEGSARVLGLDIVRDAIEIRRQTGVLTETPSLYEALTARENLRFVGEIHNIPPKRLAARIDELLEQFGLENRADEPVGAFSRGMKQRLAIARALLHEPLLLFLDEPTAGLDPAAARQVTDLIEDLSHRQGRTIFMCTHNLTEAQRLCNVVGVIDRGVLRAVGSPEELARRLWQTVSVEIDFREAPSPAILEAIEKAPSVSGWQANGGCVIVEMASTEAIPDLVAAVVQAGGRVYGVRPRAYSLEDIYFQLQNEATAR